MTASRMAPKTSSMTSTICQASSAMITMIRATSSKRAKCPGDRSVEVGIVIELRNRPAKMHRLLATHRRSECFRRHRKRIFRANALISISAVTFSGDAVLIELPCEWQPNKQIEDITMSDDRTEGSLKKMKGDVKEGAGNLTGDSKLKSEGKADKAEGKIQNAIGGIKDALTGKKEP